MCKQRLVAIKHGFWALGRLRNAATSTPHTQATILPAPPLQAHLQAFDQYYLQGGYCAPARHARRFFGKVENHMPSDAFLCLRLHSKPTWFENKITDSRGKNVHICCMRRPVRKGGVTGVCTWSTGLVDTGSKSEAGPGAKQCHRRCRATFVCASTFIGPLCRDHAPRRVASYRTYLLYREHTILSPRQGPVKTFHVIHAECFYWFCWFTTDSLLSKASAASHALPRRTRRSQQIYKGGRAYQSSGLAVDENVCEVFGKYLVL